MTSTTWRRWTRYLAEALVFERLPVEALLGATCYNTNAASALEAEVRKRNVNLRVLVKPTWYF